MDPLSLKQVIQLIRTTPRLDCYTERWHHFRDLNRGSFKVKPFPIYRILKIKQQIADSVSFYQA